MARLRSPNYPQIGLAAAVERARLIYKAERQNPIDRVTAVKLMGFGGYNGASAGVLSAVIKFGLLESHNEEMRITDLATHILAPHDEAEKVVAIKAAAQKPTLFVELAERWPNDPPSDHSLRAFLTRRGFSDNALEGVIKSYWDTASLVREVSAQYEGADRLAQGASDMEELANIEERRTSAPAPTFPQQLSKGPNLNLVRTDEGYIVQLSGSVLTQGHVDEVVTLLTALKASMPINSANVGAQTEH